MTGGKLRKFVNKQKVSWTLRKHERLERECWAMGPQDSGRLSFKTRSVLSKSFDNEHSLKAKVIQRLRESKRFGSKPIIATEYRVGSTGVRADLVVASRTTREVVAIEIKSAMDTLQRLPHQLAAYTRYFDRVILVAAHRHQPRVRQLRVAGLEIWEVENSGILATVRPGIPLVREENLSDLLTQRERLRYRGLVDAGRAGARDAFFATFEDRHGGTSDLFWSRVSGQVTVNCLAALSRFEAEREYARQRQALEFERFSSWHSEVAA